MAKVLVSGGTGLVGRALTKRLEQKGYDVHILSRNPVSGDKAHFWDWEKNIVDSAAIQSADYIVHLAGANIFEKRWSPERKTLILDSRVKSGKLLLEIVKSGNKKPKAFITASAVGIYGSGTSSHVFSEKDPAANDFLGRVCKQWEGVADEFANTGIRVVKLRTGFVISENASAFKRVISTVKTGLGAALGTGEQYLPWIHIDDLCNIYIKAIEDVNFQGAYNAVAPAPVTNLEFVNTVASLYNKSTFLPKVPSVLVKLFFGERAQMLLEGSCVSSDKILASGYKFLYPDIISALKQTAE